MSDSTRELIRDLHAAGVGGDLLGRVAEMVAVGPMALAAPLEAAVRSPGALRTARWRARKAASQASQCDVTSVTRDAPVTVSVQPASGLWVVGNEGFPGASTDHAGAPDWVLPLMTPVTSVTPVTLRDARLKKENPPHPLKKEPPTPSPKKGVSPPQASQPHRPNWRHHTDPVFREIEAMRKRSAPQDKRGGWEFKTELLLQAERRIASRVTPMRHPETPMLTHGPPAASRLR